MTSFNSNKTVIGNDSSTTKTVIGTDASTTVHITIGDALPVENTNDPARTAQRIAAIQAAKYRSFISYSADEVALARRLAALLHANATLLTPAFFAEQSIAIGRNWYDELIAALNTIDYLFVIFSPQSFGKHWLHVESGVALAHKKHIIPVLHGAISHNSLPFPYQLFQSSLRLDEGDERLIAGLHRVRRDT